MGGLNYSVAAHCAAPQIPAVASWRKHPHFFSSARPSSLTLRQARRGRRNAPYSCLGHCVSALSSTSHAASLFAFKKARIHLGECKISKHNTRCASRTNEIKFEPTVIIQRLVRPLKAQSFKQKKSKSIMSSKNLMYECRVCTQEREP